MKFVIATGVVVLLGIAFRLAVPRLVNNSVATGIVVGQDGSQLGDCPNTPNCVSSESSSASHKVERFALKKGADKAIDTLANIIESQPGTAIVQKDDRYLHATYTTKIMGYVDDVEFLVVDDQQKGDQQSVQVRSASRLGKSDLGANAKRVQQLRADASGKL